MNPYLDALRRIPVGETRSFLELAAAAGRPGAARAAGRAIASCRGSSELPWHRVVSADGRSHNAATRSAQLRRLRREGARPRANESIQAWARRTGARFVGSYATREFTGRADARVRQWKSDGVEGFASEAQARARGFFPSGSSEKGEVPLPATRAMPQERESSALSVRCRQVEWRSVRENLETRGVHRLRSFLSPSECAGILNDSTRPDRFERTIVMLPRGYGVGSYHYYREPLPSPANELRETLYRELAPTGYPKTLAAFWDECRRRGQKRASSILIGYGGGGVNHPHRDVYGPVSFPYQALIALSKRGRDFSGGNFYVVDEEDGALKREIAVDEGDVVIFATHERRVNGKRAPLRHGMTMVTKGTRYGLGVVFHLAE